MLKIQNHDLIMKKLLLSIYSNPKLANQLGFKGGTCLYYYKNLDRFSTDLDFNLLSETLNVNEIDKIIKSIPNLKVIDYKNKFNTWFWALNYEPNAPKIKIEISKRDYPDTYVTQDDLGINITIMSDDCMFAHKLCAISDRKIMQNRDLYDALFMFKHNYPINEEIIKIRTSKSVKEYFGYLIEYINQNVNQHKILDGLGEVLDQSQKNYYKQNLLKDLIFELKLRT
jgi:predicted nucleotidyltransferase component of viral defense system